MTTEAMQRLQLTNALYDVLDPETGLNLVDLGLIYEVSFSAASGKALVVMTFTTPACPAGDVMTQGVKRRLLQEPGVEDVDVDVTFSPAWTPERISAEGRAQLGL
jgi:metal-sulfur cluster biosynthetic enzyme